MLEQQLVNELKAQGLTITFAESCTAGLASATLVNVSGASLVYKGGFVTYSNETKQSLLGVLEDILNTYGAISEHTTNAMAKGALRQINADIAVAISGNAGPLASEGKPVGCVCISVTDKNHTVSKTFLFEGTRSDIRKLAVENAFAMAIAFLKGENV
ncbi:MAG: CinA family protein [Lachnospiraceae bacterium]|nr:CinA family protein [Lachnospira sp.]MBR6697813.1 CinA family protein [Lachnospiraceae bacterium]